MMSLKQTIGLSIASLVFVACAADTAKLGAPPTEYQNVTKTAAGIQQVTYEPKIDILFVIDNSWSMEVHQQRLARNIDLFAQEFIKNKQLDFHIGVTSVYDSVTARDPRFQINVNGVVSPLQPPAGSLRPIPKLDEAGKVVYNGKQKQFENSYFMTRETPRFLESLKALLNIGQFKKPDGGTEFEESFSPVYHAFTDQLNSETNKGFYRQDAYLLVVFITDTDDQTPGINEQQLHQLLVDLKQDASKVTYSGALAWIAKDPTTGEYCHSALNDEPSPFSDPQHPGKLKISSLIEMQSGYNPSKPRQLNLCNDNYGREMANIGLEIKKIVLRREIQLEDDPEINSARPDAQFKVTYGRPDQKEEDRQVIPRSNSLFEDPKTHQTREVPYEEGWSWDKDRRVITVHEGVDLDPIPGAFIMVDYRAIIQANRKNGRVIKAQPKDIAPPKTIKAIPTK